MRFLALSLALFTLPALACPVLTGHYLTCRSQNNPSEVSGPIEITQSLTNGITTFSITQDELTEVIKANGKTTSKTEVDPDSGMTVKTYLTGSCTSAAFSMRVAIYMDGQLMANVTTRYSKVENQLHQQLTGSALGDSVADKIICE